MISAVWRHSDLGEQRAGLRRPFLTRKRDHRIAVPAVNRRPRVDVIS
jgi:hypothetical protein